MSPLEEYINKYCKRTSGRTSGPLITKEQLAKIFKETAKEHATRGESDD